MQKVNAHSLEKALSLLLEDEQNLMQSIIRAHEETCDYTNEKVQPLLETARSRPIYAQCPQMVSFFSLLKKFTNRLMRSPSRKTNSFPIFSTLVHALTSS